MAAPTLLIAAFLFIPAALDGTGAGATFGLDLHHRFSDTVRRWIESRHSPPPGGAWRWPERGVVEYYTALARHDLTLRGRALTGGATKAPLEVTFSGGNETLAISSLGFLHYATVTIGTSGLSFLVALDTGSDLFWLSCDCSRCAPTASSAYGYGDVNIPKTKKTYYKNKACKKHTLHKVLPSKRRLKTVFVCKESGGIRGSSSATVDKPSLFSIRRPKQQRRLP